METASKAILLRDALRLYRPLLVILLVSIAGAAAMAGAGRVPLMDGVMGLFLCFLAVLQLFDLRGYARSFAKYDAMASRVPLYGLAYPFIELALGLLYLSGTVPLATNIAMLMLGAVSAVGVMQTIRRGDAVSCVCAGAGFVLPVGWVTLFENLAMAGMAAANLTHFLT